MRALLGLAAVLGLLAVAPPQSATAGDRCGCGPAFRAPRGYDRCRIGGRFDAGYGCSSARWRRYVRTRTYAYDYEAGCVRRGAGWLGLGRYYDPVRIEPRHLHPRRFFFDRWPCRLGGAAPTFLGHACPGSDFPYGECGIAKAALRLDDDAPPLEASSLGLEDRLALGMERFYRGAFEEAAADFGAACRLDPDEPRALAGRLMTALMRGETDEAVDALRRLDAQGEVRATDRLVLEACMDRPERFLDVRDAMTTATRWQFHRVEPLVVAAWANVTTGETATARGQLRAALRFAPSHPVARRLLDGLEGRPQRAPRAPTPTAGESLPETSDALAREVADR